MGIENILRIIGSSHDDIIHNRNHVQQYYLQNGGVDQEQCQLEVCHKASSEFKESTMTDNKSHTPTVSVLEKLKAPKHSDLTQKNAVDLSPPPKGKKGLDILRIISSCLVPRSCA